MLQVCFPWTWRIPTHLLCTPKAWCADQPRSNKEKREGILQGKVKLETSRGLFWDTGILFKAPHIIYGDLSVRAHRGHHSPDAELFLSSRLPEAKKVWASLLARYQKVRLAPPYLPGPCQPVRRRVSLLNYYSPLRPGEFTGKAILEDSQKGMVTTSNFDKTVSWVSFRIFWC